jgi:hypothetical protein
LRVSLADPLKIVRVRIQCIRKYPYLRLSVTAFMGFSLAIF